MDILRQFQNMAWCKPDWCFPSMSKETNELLKQCVNLPSMVLSDEVEEIIKKSKAFPIEFPIETVRLEKLKETRPLERLKRNIISTYPLIHERVLLLMTHFLIYKREFGSQIEKALYKDMTVAELIDRILQKRAVSFLGSQDKYKLLSGETGQEGWEAVGTLQQKPPLLLDRCLSYDEMKVAAMVYVSGHTECVNSGARHNAGAPADAEDDAVIVGLIGPRFKRKGRMDYEDIVITEQQNCLENGYGEEVTPTTCLNVLKTTYVRNNQSARHMWRQMWSEFYQVHSYTYEELTSYVDIQDKSEEKRYTDRYVKLANITENEIFDNEVYYKRLTVIVETALVEAEWRARESGRDAFLNIIGCGLGVWKISHHQVDVYILSFLERIRAFLKKDHLNHVSDINFAFIEPSKSIMSLFMNEEKKSEKKVFFESKRHPRGGINVQFENRDPSARLQGEHQGKLLVLTYPWDGNAHPGNEFWFGSLTSSGDAAAACSTQVSELHNAHINSAVCARNVRVAGRHGLCTLPEYCSSLTS